MTELGEHRLTVELEATGERTDAIKSYRLDSSYLTPADSFEFVVYNDKDPRSLRRKWQPLRRVRLFIDGELQMLGRIDETEGMGDSSSSLRVTGRDYIGELVDGGADPSIRFTENTDLGAAMLTLFRPFGIRTIVGNFNLTRNLLTGKQPFVGEPRHDFKAAKLTDYKIEANQGTYEAADRIVARHGFTIQQALARDTVCVVEPLFGQDPLYALTRPGVIKRGTARRSYADVPTVTIATSHIGKRHKKRLNGDFDRDAAQPDPSKVFSANFLSTLLEIPSFGELAPNEIGKFDEVKRIALEPVSLLRSAYVSWKAGTMPFEPEDDVIYRPIFYEDKDSKTDQQIERGIRRELSRRMKDVLTYSCTVRGHRNQTTGAVYAIDTIAGIKDDVEDVDQNMWLLERSFSNSGTGPETSMKFILPGAIAL